MARILILEDNAERIKLFKRKFIGHYLVITDQSPVAIELLSKENWDFLFLDHDLGGQEMVDSGPGTGFEVARYLFDNPDRKPSQGIVLHSMNPIGRANMAALLPEAVEMPGVLLDA